MLGIALFALAPSPAHAETWPTQPVRVLVGFSAGSGPDVLARAVSAQLSLDFKRQFYVENQSGANGTLAISAVARAEPTGHTLLFTSGSISPVPFMYKSLRVDILKDLKPVATVGVLDGLLMLVHPDLPVRTVADLVAHARANRLLYGSPGVGNTLHLATELFRKKAGIALDHLPFRGAGEISAALLAGTIHLMMVTPPSVLSLVESGQLRAIALTGSKPFPALPNVPLMKDQLADYPVTRSWGMYLAPSGTPDEIVERLNRAIRAALHVPAVGNVVQKAGYIPDERSPAETAAFLRDEIAAAGEAVEAAGLKPN